MASKFTKYKDKHDQLCCNELLNTLEDHYGGGSHYWTLKCKLCKKRYTYDTYSFKLREWPE
jgi:hypothetical protein